MTSMLLLLGYGTPRLLIAGEEAPLQLGPAESTADPLPDPHALARAVAEASRKHRATGASLVLALSSDLTLAARVVLPDEHPTRQEMLFLLEEFLPLSAEELAADFVVHPQEAMGVATESQRLRPLVAALVEEGMAPTLIVPLALLVVQDVLCDLPGGCEALVIPEPTGWSAFALLDGRPRAWHLTPASPEALASRLDLLGVTTVAVLSTVAAPPITLHDGWTELPGRSTFDHAAHAAARIAAGDAAPLVDLRRGALEPTDRLQPVRQPLVAAAMAIAVLLLALAGSLFFSAQQWEDAADALRSEQRKAYTKLYPGQEVPPGLIRRLEMEVDELERESAGGTPGAPDAERSAFAVLVDLLERLPQGEPIDVFSINVVDGGYTLKWRSSDFASPDRVRQALAADGRYRVEVIGSSGGANGMRQYDLKATLVRPDVRSASREVTP